MKVRAGTSGYSYKEWKGSFYPEKLPAAKMLGHYADRLPAVEINSTFYRMPRAEVVESWAAQVPDTFRFVVKASRRITHLKRLKDVGEETEYLLTALEGLGSRLGAILFQLPPNLPKDMVRLEAFLALLPGATRAVLEFRHPSWMDEEVFECLRRRQCPLCHADTDDDADVAPLISTSSWGYLRLRRPGYSGPELDAWAERVRARGWDEVFVFFKHEDEGAGPRMADEFMQRFGP